MTENEAMSVLHYLLGCENAVDAGEIDEHNCLNSQEKEALKFILEEIQLYRAIGTVEELESMKENGAFTGVELASLACMQMKLKDYQSIGTVEEIQKVISFLSNDNDNSIIDDMNMLNTYKFIGTIEEFKALKEKSEPKKAIGKRKYDEAYCPACNKVISDGEFWALDEYVHHCNYCGQAVKGIDWSK